MHVPVYLWLVAMYPLACGHIFHMSCTHEQGAMYSCADFCYVLWDIMQNFVVYHKPQCRILFCAMGLVQNFVMCYGSQRRISLSTMDQSAE